MNTKQLAAIEKHGRQLLAIFPEATIQEPVSLCKALRKLESQAAAVALRQCNGPEFSSPEELEKRYATILGKVNQLLGNVREYQPKTGAKCGCKRGIERDNCSTCEGTGHVIDFKAIRNRRPLVPIFINRDPRGYQLKIDDAYAAGLVIHKDWGGYGIIAPDIDKHGN